MTRSRSPNDPRVGVAMIVRRGDEVLLLRRTGAHGSGSWSTPGGHLDPGETIEGCARRESLEEVGVTVGDVRFRAVTNDMFAPEDLHYITIWMEGEHVDGEPTARATREVTEVGWFRHDDLPDPLFLSLKNLLEARSLPPNHDGLAPRRGGPSGAPDGS